MRHVPEDELHAYLDQALSRSQAVEIETHLAACGRCRDARDSIAGLRDHTTALLNRLTPKPLIVPPPFQSLVVRHQAMPAPAAATGSLRRAGLWAAAFVAAIGLGWAGRSIFGNGEPVTAPTLAAVAPSPAPPAQPTDVAESNRLESLATPVPLPEHPVRFVATRPASYQAASLVPAPNLQLVSEVLMREFQPRTPPAPTPDVHSPYDHIWRQVTWEEALKAVGSGLPFIEGMTVVGVLLQPGTGGERPTVIVTQQDRTGEIVQSIEGPASRMPELVQQQSAPDTHASEIIRTPPDYIEGPGGVRRSLRALSLVGRLPADSLNILARLATLR